MRFAVEHADGMARAGFIETDHGRVHTPAFMPVGTQGSVKAMEPRGLLEVGCQIILANTYHLFLRPGPDIIRAAGGLHRFVSWELPILTDSGGYQVFSLSNLKKISEDGVEFRSHLDGTLYLFTPESVVDIQRMLGSDIMMVLDECAAYPCEFDQARKAHDLTINWAKRCLERFKDSGPIYDHDQSIFAIVQGSVYPELRRQGANLMAEMGFDGYAVGGLSVGEPGDVRYEMTAECADALPEGKPRYLMGVGTPLDLLESIGRGMDMFDCVLPTRNGRNAMAFTRLGPLSLKNALFKYDLSPLDEGCSCYTCRSFSRAYLRHLFQAEEILALQLTTMHNLHYYQWLMREARAAIVRGQFHEWKSRQLEVLTKESDILSQR